MLARCVNVISASVTNVTEMLLRLSAAVSCAEQLQATAAEAETGIKLMKDRYIKASNSGTRSSNVTCHRCRRAQSSAAVHQLQVSWSPCSYCSHLWCRVSMHTHAHVHACMRRCHSNAHTCRCHLNARHVELVFPLASIGTHV